MRNAMQLKAKIRNISREKRISAQVVLQNYMMERLLERVSNSLYKSSFILKGGMLISAMIGLESRTKEQGKKNRGRFSVPIYYL